MKPTPSEKLRVRVIYWAGVLRVKPSQIRIQAMTRKWGSCSSSGCVTFSFDLVKRPIAFQDFVIAHELLHLRIRNHGKLFRSTLSAVLRNNVFVSAGTVARAAKSKKSRTAHN